MKHSLRYKAAKVTTTEFYRKRLPTNATVILFYFCLFLRNNLSAKYFRLEILLLTYQLSAYLFAIAVQIDRFSQK